MSGLSFTQHWPQAGEWWALNAYRPNEGPTVGFYLTGEHIEEHDALELGHRTAAFLEGENPALPRLVPRLTMPRRALQVCPHPGCPTLTPKGPCDLHRREGRRNQARQRRASGDPSMDAYSTTEWRTRRKAYLHSHPHCHDCGAPATEPDHVPPRQLLLALGVHDPDADQWLTPRCSSCHARKTRKIDEPLLKRWRNGEDASELAEEAMKLNVGVG